MDKLELINKTHELKILIIDDMSANAILLERMLNLAGFSHISILNDPRFAIEKILTEKPDIIFLDILMPYLNGFEVLEKMQMEGVHSIPVIVITAQNDKENHKRASDFDAADFIGKPFDAIEVIMRVKNVAYTKVLYDYVLKLEREIESLKTGR